MIPLSGQADYYADPTEQCVCVCVCELLRKNIFSKQIYNVLDYDVCDWD